MDEMKSKIETDKKVESPSQKSEIQKKEADEILEKRLNKENNKSEQKNDSTDKKTDSEVEDDSAILEPNCKYFKDGHTYETDDKCNIFKVDGKLLPNTTYEVNGYTYITDDKGRVMKVTGELKLEPGERDKNAQIKAGGDDRQPSDQGGHLIADRFGGAGGIENLVAMKSELNQGEYKKLENDLAKAMSEGKEVTVSITVNYEGDSQRPSSITVTYTIDGEIFKRTFTN